MTSILDDIKLNYFDNVYYIVEKLDYSSGHRETYTAQYGSTIMTGNLSSHVSQRIIGFEPIKVKLPEELIEKFGLYMLNIRTVNTLLHEDYFFNCYTDKFKLLHCFCMSIECDNLGNKYALIKFDAVDPLEDHLMVG